MADTSNLVTDAVDKFNKLPTGGKVAVVGITAGVAVVGIIIANRRAAAASSTTSGSPTLNGGNPLDPTQLFSGSGLLGTPGSTDTITANGPPTPVTTPTPTPPPTQTGSIPTPAPSGTPGLSNNFHVIQVGSATPFKTLADIAVYAQKGATKGSTWNPSSVFSYRNNSMIFQALGMTANQANTPIPAASVSISI